MSKDVTQASQFYRRQQGASSRAAVVPIDIYNELMTLQKALSDNKPGSASSTTSTARGPRLTVIRWASGRTPASWCRRAPPPTARRCRLPARGGDRAAPGAPGQGVLSPRPKGASSSPPISCSTARAWHRQLGGGQQPKRPGCLAKQRRLHPQAIRLWQEGALTWGPVPGLAPLM